MGDLVERLENCSRYNSAVDPREMCLEAASAISRLKGEVERLEREKMMFRRARNDAEARVKALEGAITAAKAYLDDEAYSCCRDELSAALISEQGK